MSLLLARALQADGRSAEAAAEFETAHRQYGSFDVLGEYELFARATGDEIDRAFAFREVFRALETRIKIFIELSDEQLASISIKHALHEIDTTQRQKP